MTPTSTDYVYRDKKHEHSYGYLWPVIAEMATSLRERRADRAFDLGCGNGSIAADLAALRFTVTGIDASQSGIAIAKASYPQCVFEVASVYDDLAARFGRFPLVLSLEVIEHLYDPRAFARTLFGLLEPGGTAIVSTPYHGYIKNCALALSGKLDDHFTALWDGGHVKFFSIRTLGAVLSEAGLRDLEFVRVGRIPVLAKSMIAIARRPSNE